MIQSKLVCYCRHLITSHEHMKVFSEAMQTWHLTNRCKVPNCHCHNFEKSTFKPVSGWFDELPEEKLSKRNLQMELFGEA